MTSSGRLTLLSKQPVTTTSTPHSITKALVKVQLTSVPSTTTTTMVRNNCLVLKKVFN